MRGVSLVRVAVPTASLLLVLCVLPGARAHQCGMIHSRRVVLAGLGSATALSATSTTARTTRPTLDPVLDRNGKPVTASTWLDAHADGRPDLVLGYQGEPYFLLSRVVDGLPQLEKFALLAECTHLGCLVSDEPLGGFACPCHGSKYSREGSVTRGPAPRSLKLARVEVGADGNLQMGEWLDVDFRSRDNREGEAALLL